MWNELQAGIECLTQLLLLIDNMSSSVISDPDLNDAAQLLQQQLIYNGDVLDIALDSLRSYKEGTQSLTYLNSSVYLAYALLHMLERWGKENSGAMYVRKKAIRKKKAKGKFDPISPSDRAWRQHGPIMKGTALRTKMLYLTLKTKVTPRKRKISYMKQCLLSKPSRWYVAKHARAARLCTNKDHHNWSRQQKFAHSEITRTLLFYLSRYKEFDSPELMTRAVNLIHRQVVKAKAEGLYFNVSAIFTPNLCYLYVNRSQPCNSSNRFSTINGRFRRTNHTKISYS